MFSVLFEVHPKIEQWEDYLDFAKLLRPELIKIEGFIDNIRYKRLTRDGWILSLSGWQDEKALVRWRTQARHHMVQEKGRSHVFSDYHLRVGQITRDNQLPEGQVLREQRLDITQKGEASTIILIDAKRPTTAKDDLPQELARWMGLTTNAPGLVSWDVFDAVLTPGDVILLMSWRRCEDADAFVATASQLPVNVRLRQIRVIRDYGMYDRYEAPQYYPVVARTV
ncbi:hypothetical protein BZG36_01471 [Bifiguratus adelaidae]|uniref:ABM domain-containing protein n=1 Tax=Bifiguratus adelaidae TaxID=1938954 RepID=A0A261Y4W2_9FUNG|nr:hypothetical protein BZG36_01471 [Bifiguratus adelaidae]